MNQLKTILKLKRTLSPITLKPLGYREIGRIIGLSPQGVKNQVETVKGCCPMCLQTLTKDNNFSAGKSSQK